MIHRSVPTRVANRSSVSGAYPVQPSAAAPPGAEDCASTIEMTAEGIRFDMDSIEAPAGEDFCIVLTNNDVVDHDIGIEETEFNGEDIGPGESITYLIPAMEAGDYTFFCTLHPRDMVGDLIVTE